MEQCGIDWWAFIENDELKFVDKKIIRPHQIEAIEKVMEGLKREDRGQMIMACGTGKTFTSLKIAEKMLGEGKMILYMMPSLALMSQSIRDWKRDAEEDFLAFSACSDEKVGRNNDTIDRIVISTFDLALPATTNPKKLADRVNASNTDKMKVVFSTYQSIEVISQAQKNHNLGKFDLIICDEAHRTTGTKITDESESNFTNP